MRLSYRPASPLVAAALLAPAAVAAQEPPDETFAEEIRVTEVLLDVVVTDKRDQIILGLGPEDFVVAENKELVEIESVSFYSSKRLLDSADVLASRNLAVDVVPQDRFFILFIQQQRSDSASSRSPAVRQREAGRDLARWLAEDAQPADRVAVVSFNRGLRVYQDFTSDREALLNAIDGAVKGSDPKKVPPSRRVAVEPEPAALSLLPTGKSLRRATPNVYRALQKVAEAAATVPGRKNLIFFGRGFGELGSYGSYRPQLSKLNPTLEALNDANIAAYTIDVSAPGVEQSLRPSLRDLAFLTGGQFYYDDMSFGPALREISDLTSGYYLLSYKSRRPADEAGYQAVRIGTRNREFRIYARRGYLYGTAH